MIARPIVNLGATCYINSAVQVCANGCNNLLNNSSIQVLFSCGRKAMFSAGPTPAVEVPEAPANQLRCLFEYITGRTAGTTRGTSQLGWSMQSRSLIEEVLSVSLVQ